VQVAQDGFKFYQDEDGNNSQVVPVDPNKNDLYYTQDQAVVIGNFDTAPKEQFIDDLKATAKSKSFMEFDAQNTEKFLDDVSNQGANYRYFQLSETTPSDPSALGEGPIYRMPAVLAAMGAFRKSLNTKTLSIHIDPATKVAMLKDNSNNFIVIAPYVPKPTEAATGQNTLSVAR
jgi:hypothetical protein